MVTESMSLDEEGEDVGDGLAGDGVGWFLVEGMAGQTRSKSLETVIFLEGTIRKKVHTLGIGEDVEQVTPQAVEVHKLLTLRNDWDLDRQ